MGVLEPSQRDTPIADVSILEYHLGIGWKYIYAQAMLSGRDFLTYHLPKSLSGQTLRQHLISLAFLTSAALTLQTTPLLAQAGSWAATGTMNVPRGGHAQVLLNDGRVLAAGGNTASGPTNSAEIYDPSTGIWSLTGSLTTARMGASAVVLPGGKVLIAGGSTTAAVLASSEIFDPATGLWTTGGNMVVARTQFTMQLLNSGQVLAAGGCANVGCSATNFSPPVSLQSAELYNPTANTWTATGSMTVARPSPSSVLLPSGKVFVTANIGINVLIQFDIYDPVAGTWSAAGPFLYPAPSLAVGLQDGRVLAFLGGTTYLYNPVANTFTAGPAMTYTQWGPTATVLRNKIVLVAGGGEHMSSGSGRGGGGAHEVPDGINELYLPSTNVFTNTTATFGYHDANAAATQLLNDTVLLTGGTTGSSATTGFNGVAELYYESSEVITPSTLTFGGQLKTTSSVPQTVTLNNTTNAKLAVTGVATTGDFTQTNTCVGYVAANSNCSISVAFDPTTTGARTGTLNVTLGDSPFADSITLNGTGISRSLWPKPLALSLSTVAGTTTTGTVLVSNDSASSSSVGLTISGTGFSQTNNCPATLTAGATCTATITFAPKTTGTFSGLFTLTGGGGSFSTTLSGIAQPVALAVTPSVLNFPALTAGDDTTLPITVQNATPVAFKLTSVSGAATPFSIANNGCGSLPAGVSCTITVDFAPTAAGTFSGSVSITDNTGVTNVVTLNGSASSAN